MAALRSAAFPFRHSNAAALRGGRRDLHPLASESQTDRALYCVRPHLKAALFWGFQRNGSVLGLNCSAVEAEHPYRAAPEIPGAAMRASMSTAGEARLRVRNGHSHGATMPAKYSERNSLFG